MIGRVCGTGSYLPIRTVSNDDDCLPMELHMKYQKYFTRKVNELRIIAAMTYCRMNQEYQYILQKPL